MRHLRILCLAVLLPAAACSDEVPPTRPPATSLRSAASGACFLTPPGEPVLRDTVVAIPIRGLPEGELDLDPRAARVGGYQDNEVPVDRDPQGEPILRPTFPGAGDAVVACSTRPRSDAPRVHHAKCLLRVVAAAEAPTPVSAQVSARIGQTLELVPLIDPLALPADEPLPVQVRAGGPARPSVAVHAFQEDPDGGWTELSKAETDAEGIALLELSDRGAHLLLVEVELTDAPEKSPRPHVATLTFHRGGSR